MSVPKGFLLWVGKRRFTTNFTRIAGFPSAYRTKFIFNVSQNPPEMAGFLFLLKTIYPDGVEPQNNGEIEMRTLTMEEMIHSMKQLSEPDPEATETPLQAIPEDTPAQDTDKPTERPRKAIRVRIGKATNEGKRKESEMRRKDRILPGYNDLKSLSRGIVREEGENIQLELKDFIEAITNARKTMDEEEQEIFFNEMEKVGLISVDRAISYCRKKGFHDLEGWLRIQNAWEKSKKGSLFDKKKS